MSRLSPGTVIVAIFAVLFGLVGAYAVRKSLQGEPQAEAPAAPPQTIVPVASIDLEPGRPLTLGDIALLRLNDEQMQEQEIPGGYMTNTQQIIGRTLREGVTQGKPFFTPQFYPENMGPSIADRLKPGLRAVTVPITPTAAVSGMTTPGTFVDVLFRNEPQPEDALPATTITLLESVEVLAIGQDIVPGARPPARVQEVTLAVTPEQASALNVVEDRGELMLALRSPQDLEYISDPQPQTLHSLLGLVEPGPPMTTEIYRGTSVQVQTFESERPTSARVTSVPLRTRGTTQTSTQAAADDEVPTNETDREKDPGKLEEVKHPAPAPSPSGDSAPGQVNRDRRRNSGLSSVERTPPPRRSTPVEPRMPAPRTTSSHRAKPAKQREQEQLTLGMPGPALSALNRQPPLYRSPKFDPAARMARPVELAGQANRVSQAFTAAATD